MVYRFKIVNDEVSNFAREIEISPDASFLELRNAILDSVDYRRDGIDSFFICDDDWSKREEITLEDMGTGSDRDTWLMEDTPLNDFVEEEGQRLIFVFDYITDRSFFMELKEIITGRNSSAPLCTMKRGAPPAQSVDLMEFEKKIDAASAKSTELDMDLTSEDGYDEDDLSSFDNMDYQE